MLGVAPSKPESILIVGAGIFGTSTALHLSRQRPSLSITLLDQSPFPCPRAASHDINKIIRAAYTDINYCSLATRAQNVWRKDPLFSKYYHEAGLLSIHPYKGGAEAILKNFKRLGINPNARLLTPEDVRHMFNGRFADADLDHVQEFLWDPHTGWAEAADALKATIQAAIDAGVSYISSAISKLVVQNGSCQGVETKDGNTYLADKVLLCTGADTARILADSAPKMPDLHVGNRFVAGAILVAKVKLNSDQIQQYKACPAVLWDAHPAHGEAMPPTTEGYLKFIRDIPLANTVKHDSSNSMISVTPATKDLTEWTDPERIPTTLRREMDVVIKGILGAAASKDLKPEQLRLCWDALSPDENWFITPHTRCGNLYIATGGTGHAWKFLPVIGEHVARMIYEPEQWVKGGDGVLAKMWHWDRKMEDSEDQDVIPRRNLQDLID